MVNLQQRQAQILIISISALIITIFIYLSVRTLWFDVQPSQAASEVTRQTEPVPRSQSTTAHKSNTQYASMIAKMHVFGKPKPKAAPKPVTKKKTRLPLILHGVAATGTQQGAIAIIASKKQPAQAYSPGDTLPGNVTLKEVHADHVILEHKGQLETLNLPKNDIQLDKMLK